MGAYQTLKKLSNGAEVTLKRPEDEIEGVIVDMYVDHYGESLSVEVKDSENKVWSVRGNPKEVTAYHEVTPTDESGNILEVQIHNEAPVTTVEVHEEGES